MPACGRQAVSIAGDWGEKWGRKPGLQVHRPPEHWARGTVQQEGPQPTVEDLQPPGQGVKTRSGEELGLTFHAETVGPLAEDVARPNQPLEGVTGWGGAGAGLRQRGRAQAVGRGGGLDHRPRPALVTHWMKGVRFSGGGVSVMVND